MKKYVIYVFTFAIGLLSLAMSYRSETPSKEPEITGLGSLLPSIESVKISQSGKEDPRNKVLRKLYTKSPINSLRLPSVGSKLLSSLSYQPELLKQNLGEHRFGNLTINSSDLLQVVETLKKLKKDEQVADLVDAYQICGSDMRGNVRFTGYYSPTVSASYKRTDEFDTPVYLSCKQEDVYSLVYVKNREEIHRMRTEGYAYLVFENGHRDLISYDGNSRTLYDDDGKKYYVTVFTPKNLSDKNQPMGASNRVPLTNDISVAVDESYIPLGAVLMAEIPIVDERGNLVSKETRYVLAQDRGSAIRGAGHIDLYMGEGEGARNRIRNMNKYGKVWLLLPKSTDVNSALAQNIH